MNFQRPEPKYSSSDTKMNYRIIPDAYDARDHQFTATATVIPDKVDLSTLCSAVEDQGQLGSCTGNSIVGALEYLENKAANPAAPFVDLSRLFVYYNERVIEGDVGQDAGAQIRDGIKSLVQWGVSTEALWPYDIYKFTKHPPAKAYHDALNRRITSYQRVAQTTDALIAAVASGFPVVIGFTVYASFESQAVANTGMVPMPKPGEKVLGGHAVLVVGYDKATGMFKVRNSWGAGWGDKGYFYMPFAYLTNHKLASDFWVVQK